MVLFFPTVADYFDDPWPVLGKRRLSDPWSTRHLSCLPPKRRFLSHAYPVAPPEPTFGLILLGDGDDHEHEQEHEDDGHVTIDLKGFRPEEVKVQLDKRRRAVTVKACTERVDEESGTAFRKSVERSFTLPEEADVDHVKPRVTKRGYLTLEVPKLDQKALELKKKEEKEAPKEDDGKEVAKPEDVVDLEIVIEKPKELKKIDPEGPFQMSLHVKGYKPEELTVEAKPNGVVTVSGRHEEKGEDGSVELKQFSRAFHVDASKFNVEKLSSTLNKDGRLMLEVERRPEKDQPKVINVPVKMIQ